MIDTNFPDKIHRAGGFRLTGDESNESPTGSALFAREPSGPARGGKTVGGQTPYPLSVHPKIYRYIDVWRLILLLRSRLERN